MEEKIGVKSFRGLFSRGVKIIRGKSSNGEDGEKMSQMSKPSRITYSIIIVLVIFKLAKTKIKSNHKQIDSNH